MKPEKLFWMRKEAREKLLNPNIDAMLADPIVIKAIKTIREDIARTYRHPDRKIQDLKKLEWWDDFNEGNNFGTGQLFSIGPLKFYFTIKRESDLNVDFVLYLESLTDILWTENFGTLEEAQAVAQKYYNQFLRDMRKDVT